MNNFDRRYLLKGGLTGVAGLGLLPQPFMYRQQPLDPKRKLTRHRNLFNADSTFLFGNGFDPGVSPYTAEVMHRFVDLLADSGVDTFLINPNTQRAWYPSKVVPTVLDGYKRGDREFFRTHVTPPSEDRSSEKIEAAMDESVPLLNRYLDLVEARVNWVTEIAKACRRRAVAPWISIRMNDMHGANSFEGSYMNCPLFKRAEYRLSGEQINPKDGVSRYLMGLNYEKRHVRDYMFSMIHELVEDYDYEGLELDWLRCPLCCEPNSSQRTIDAITDWIVEIRDMTRRQARKKGTDYPLGLRVPRRLELMRSIGLDVKALVRKGLIDFVGVSNSWQTAWEVPYDQLRAELGDEVTLYGVVEAAPNWIEAFSPVSGRREFRLTATSAPLMRGSAAGKLALGADGIEQFNFFGTASKPHAAKDELGLYSELRDLPHLERLRSKPKHYVLSSMQGLWMFPLFELAEQVPCVLEVEDRRAFRLPMSAEPADPDLELIIQLVLEKKETSLKLGVSFNESWPNFNSQTTQELLFPAGPLTHHVPEHQALNYHFTTSAIKDGWNEILVINGCQGYSSQSERNAKDGSARGTSPYSACKIVSIELAVKEKQS
ncbi:MAG: hypothetical protein L0387_07350 [Acidobacteria bacterium]|nr:hypothetical protein [Acidobacteriota bacterium]MCI0720943.1 hypothetical protein [Acidobacteriota bacterium]